MKKSARIIALLVAALAVVAFFALFRVDRIGDHTSFIEETRSVEVRPIAPVPTLSPANEIEAKVVRDPFIVRDVRGKLAGENGVRSWLENSRLVDVSGPEALIRLDDGAVYSVRAGDVLLDGKVRIVAVNASTVDVRYSEIGDGQDEPLQQIVLSR